MTKNEAKTELKEAKELLDMGIMERDEFEGIKQECFVVLGMRESKLSAVQSIPCPPFFRSPSFSLSLVKCLQKYAKENQGDWLSQKSGRLLGYLLDYLSPDISQRPLKGFVNVSYEERLLYHLLQSDTISLQQHYNEIRQMYHPTLVEICVEVWEKVLGKKSGIHISPRPTGTTPAVASNNAQRRQGFNSISELHEMVYIPADTFIMGALSDDNNADGDEEPRHKVTITKGFWLGKYVVTQKLYKMVMGKNPSAFKGEKLPVEQVSWCDAVLFCNMLSEKEGLTPAYEFPGPFKNDKDWAQKVKLRIESDGYRLPTEAEWEYAARGGESHKYSGSNNIDEVAWYNNNSNEQPHPVGQKKANGFGLYDMSGNVWEWCSDAWKREYSSSAVVAPIYVDTSVAKRVDRGGSWHSRAKLIRVSYRSRGSASFRSHYQGFRVLRMS